MLGPCTGGSATKWNFASDSINFGPIKHQVSPCKRWFEHGRNQLGTGRYDQWLASSSASSKRQGRCLSDLPHRHDRR